ncbi:MAG: hypothetical protein KKB31_02540 [Nanoarchaeota archaeon]|nr:hypothetical protein [Nanoarchaeota archaeon]
MTTNALQRAKQTEYEPVAELFAQQGDVGGARAALKKYGLTVEDPVLKRRLSKSYDSDDAVMRMADGASENHDIDSVPITDMFALYDSVGSKVSGPAQQKWAKYLAAKYKAGTFGAVEKELRAANRVLRDRKDFTPEEVQTAEAVKAEHAAYLFAKGRLSQTHTNGLVHMIQTESTVEGLEKMADQLPQ